MVKIDYSEFEFSFLRSRGPGGQNVNKTNSAAQLRWDVSNSNSLSEQQKEQVLTKLSGSLVDGQYIIFRSDTFRDQRSNKDECIRKLMGVVENALKKKKKRIATRPSKTAVRKRLDKKTQAGLTKKLRSRVSEEY